MHRDSRTLAPTDGLNEPSLEFRLQRQIRRLQVSVGLLAVAVVALLFAVFWRERAEHQRVRTRGIVIDDEQGRERILISAPIPAARNRVRTNPARAQVAWT